MTRDQQDKGNGVLPFGWSVALVLTATALCYWFFGGGHYLANHSQIDYRHFHNPDDENDPFTWFSWLLETGILPALSMLLACTVALIIVRLQKR